MNLFREGRSTEIIPKSHVASHLAQGLPVRNSIMVQFINWSIKVILSYEESDLLQVQESTQETKEVRDQ